MQLIQLFVVKGKDAALLSFAWKARAVNMSPSGEGDLFTALLRALCTFSECKTALKGLITVTVQDDRERLADEVSLMH
jgi:hypothetical protein